MIAPVMGLLDLGRYAEWQKPYAARRIALERCIERETDLTRLASLRHALERVLGHKRVFNALLTE
jgi:S-adenosylmethionine:diacylglycerol 3-amino-3-carboxypropyl transferase